jgi:hypothetical protein
MCVGMAGTLARGKRADQGEDRGIIFAEHRRRQSSPGVGHTDLPAVLAGQLQLMVLRPSSSFCESSVAVAVSRMTFTPVTVMVVNP